MWFVLGISAIKNLYLVITIPSRSFKEIHKNFFYFVKSILWNICQLVDMTILPL